MLCSPRHKTLVLTSPRIVEKTTINKKAFQYIVAMYVMLYWVLIRVSMHTLSVLTCVPGDV